MSAINKVKMIEVMTKKAELLMYQSLLRTKCFRCLKELRSPKLWTWKVRKGEIEIINLFRIDFRLSQEDFLRQESDFCIFRRVAEFWFATAVVEISVLMICSDFPEINEGEVESDIAPTLVILSQFCVLTPSLALGKQRTACNFFYFVYIYLRKICNLSYENYFKKENEKVIWNSGFFQGDQKPMDQVTWFELEITILWSTKNDEWKMSSHLIRLLLNHRIFSQMMKIGRIFFFFLFAKSIFSDGFMSIMTLFLFLFAYSRNELLIFCSNFRNHVLRQSELKSGTCEFSCLLFFSRSIER